eukprot:GHVU01232039.1.p4 GENE.GHVU01232039.1~~GHVU01232039.1.p4  ORF type:complete len:103 (-),score=6.32 GHVU01232039.1:464-772(-)
MDSNNSRTREPGTPIPSFGHSWLTGSAGDWIANWEILFGNLQYVCMYVRTAAAMLLYLPPIPPMNEHKGIHELYQELASQAYEQKGDLGESLTRSASQPVSE